MTLEERTTIYKKIFRKKTKIQLIIAIEEMSELTKELTKTIRGHNRRNNIIEEIGDVRIMLEALEIIFDCRDEVSKQITFKLSEMAQGNTLYLLIVAAFVSIILGMGITTTAVYITVAVLMAPTLVKAGINPVAAHFFLLYFGIISNITPPVAVAAYAASGISGAKPMPTAITASKIGVAGFIIPFLIAYGPALVMQDTPTRIFITFITACIGVYLMAVSIQGLFLSKKIGIGYRILTFCTSLLMLFPSTETDIVGFIFIGFIIIRMFIERTRKK